jgi:transposase
MASLQRRKVNGYYYWYIVESRRINGKPRPITIAYLGSVEKILDMVKNGIDVTNVKSYSHGAVYALWNIANKNNILDILKSVFPPQKRDGLDRSTSILISAIYRAIYPGSKNEFADWVKTTSLPSILNFNPEKIDSQHFWDQMDGITEDMLSKAEDIISEMILKNYDISLEKLALDYTNYFTYIDSANKKSKLANRGHNKQKRSDLRQFSLALITSKEFTIPLCSYVYEGNINDITVFPEYLEQIKKRASKYSELDNITLVYDKGSVSKDNLKAIENHESSINYICGFSLSSCKELYDIPENEYIKAVVKDKEVLYYRVTKKIWDKNRDCVLTYSNELKEGQYNGLLNSVAKKIDKLNELKKQLRNDKSRISRKPLDIDTKIKGILSGDYGKDIIIVDKVGIKKIVDINFYVDEENMTSIIEKYYGKKLLITTRNTWSSEEIIETYLDQYAIESIFKDTKNPHHFAIHPQYHWTDQKVRVHTFNCLLGLLLTSLLKKELNDKGIKIENKKLIDTLHNIRLSYLMSSNKKKKWGVDVKKVIEDMNENEEKIWNCLNEVFDN